MRARCDTCGGFLPNCRACNQAPEEPLFARLYRELPDDMTDEEFTLMVDCLADPTPDYYLGPSLLERMFGKKATA